VPTINGKEVKLFINGVELKGAKVGDSSLIANNVQVKECHADGQGSARDETLFDDDGNYIAIR